jgi:putative intracellular protease/amidase
VPRKILTLLSEYGYWGEELVGPITHFDKAGYEVVFATPTGKWAHALPPSLDPRPTLDVGCSCPSVLIIRERRRSSASLHGGRDEMM